MANGSATTYLMPRLTPYQVSDWRGAAEVRLGVEVAVEREAERRRRVVVDDEVDDLAPVAVGAGDGPAPIAPLPERRTSGAGQEVRLLGSGRAADVEDQAVHRLEHQLAAEGLRRVVVDRVVPPVRDEELEVDRVGRRVVEAETGEEDRLVELEQQAPGVEEVQLRVGHFGPERLVPLAEVERDLVGGLERRVRLPHVLHAEAVVGRSIAAAARSAAL